MNIVSISDDHNTIVTDDGVTHRAAITNEFNCSNCDFDGESAAFCKRIHCHTDGNYVVFIKLAGEL